MYVKDLMSAKPQTLTINSCVRDALTLMFEQRMSCLMVCDNAIPVGIITERDILEAYHQEVCVGTPCSIDVIMTRDPTCVHESMPVQEALTIARKQQIRHLPVVNKENELSGLVTQVNLIEAFIDSLERNDSLESDNRLLEHLSLEDPLLNIGNRRKMELEMDIAVMQSKRRGKPYSVSLIDVDFFKKYNDNYGHLAGDNVLKQVADLIKDCLRKDDKVYRFGGEEFLVLMENSEEAEAGKSSKRILKCIQNAAIEHNFSPYEKLTASAGVCSSMQNSWQEVVEMADTALYQAKQAGRNRVFCSAESCS